MRYALQILLFGFAGVVLAQNRPQMTWEGYITDGAVLYIQGDRVDMQGRNTGSVDRPRYHFNTSLPASQQRVDVEVQRGRGRVEVVEQPERSNEYSAVVRIDPPAGEREHYALNFYWDGAGRRRDLPQSRNRTVDRASSGEMTWAGEVDAEILVEVRARRAFARTIRGRETAPAQTSFSGPMPRNAKVSLRETTGRGRIELVEQPSRDNGNVALVRILDPQNSVGQYSFRLVWNGGSDDPYYNSGQGGVLTPERVDPRPGAFTAGGLRWSGLVDGKVRVTVRGDRVWTTRLSGGPVQREQVDFGRALPRGEVNDVELRKVEGREDVKIVEKPSASNGYTLIFEIDDDDAGAAPYVVEVTWR